MNMRAIVDAVDSEYGNAKAWKLHWDRQLLKALGVAYRYSTYKILIIIKIYMYNDIFKFYFKIN